MKTKITVLLLLFINLVMFSQPKKELGTIFDYDEKKEKDLKVVLVDNYNHFMFSVINIDGGMMPTNQIIIRKFDQKNQLVNTFIEEFPYKDVFTLHNYLGSFELGIDKLVVFTECYSNKTKKKEIHKIIFDKKTSAFTTTLVGGYTFESLSKSGTTFAMSSQNKNYIGIVYSKFANKKIAEEHECIVFDGKTSEIVWQKNISFPLLSFTDNMVLNDSGKFVFVRNTKETGSQNVLAIVDGNTIENKDFGKEDVIILKPLLFSIDSKEYLVAFNSFAHGINYSGYFGKILIYDLTSGKVLKNNFIKDFDQIKDLNTVSFNAFSIQNNEIHLFVDCYIKTATKPDTTYPGSTFTVPVYSNAYPKLFVFSMEGELKKSISYNSIITPLQESIVKCFGVKNINSNYYFNTCQKRGQFFYYALFKLNPDYTLNENGSNFGGPTLEVKPSINEPIISQFINYLPDSKRLIVAELKGAGKMVFINISDIEL